MPTDEERREVARRLRESRESAFDYRGQLEEVGINLFCFDQADYYLIYKSVYGSLPAEHMDTCDYAEFHGRLADLIEPEPERTCRNVSDNETGFTCSECGASVTGWDYSHSYVDESGVRWYTTADAPRRNYCPHCGARVIDGVLG